MIESKLQHKGQDTESSLKYWKKNKTVIGPVVTASCDATKETGHLRITGEGVDFILSGCTCGYGGTGPQGTANVLRDLGIPEEVAWALAQSDKFLIFFDESGVKLLLDGKIL